MEVGNIKRSIIGVMGGSQFVFPEVEQWAYKIGLLIAQEGCILLNGGHAFGVMEASARGAKEGGGITIGILPEENECLTSKYIDIPIKTGMGMARNVINVLSSDFIIALPGSAGTISEIALALNHKKMVILFQYDVGEWVKPFQRKGLLLSIQKLEDLKHTIQKNKAI